jgi:DNA transposition AAA+ family ATPase
MSSNLKYNGWQQVRTLQSKEILAELNDAKKRLRAKLIINDTGAGKTNTVKLFKEGEPTHTYVIKVGDSFKLVDVVDEILLQMGISKWRYSTRIREKLQMISDTMSDIRKNGGNPLIIIDEGENLKPNSLRMMKELYDYIIDFCSIVIIGTEQILDTIFNKRKRNRQSVPQLWRRFKAGTRFISTIDKARDFKAFFQLYIPNEQDLQDLLIELCENYGELHDYLDPVLEYASDNNKPATEELFRLFHKMPKHTNNSKLKRVV